MKFLLVLSYTLLGIALFWSNGRYETPALLLTLGSFGVLIAAAVFFVRKKDWHWSSSEHLLPAALLVLMGIQFLKPPLMYAAQWYRVSFQIALGVSIACVAAGMIDAVSPVIRKWALVLAAALGALCYLLIPIASPEPFIDVWYFSQEAVEHVLEGFPPYSTPVTDIYGNHETFGTPGGYLYLPANLYAETLSYIATGDVRFLFVLSILIGSLLLYCIARRTGDGVDAPWIALLFLYHPRGMFVVEQSWIEPFVLLMFFLFVWLRTRSAPPSAASAVYGFFLSLKQTLLFFPFHFLMIERRPKQLLLATVIAALTVVPFLITDPQGLWENGVWFALSLPYRTDSLSVTSYLALHYGLQPSLWLNLGWGALLSVATFVLFRRHGLTGYLFAVSITMFGIFLFGKHAFCNYYYFVSGLLMALLAAGINRDVSTCNA